MSILALIRHGQYQQLADTPSALQPYPLTAEGETEVHAQARAFAQWIRTERLTVCSDIHCSTSLRAWQTAKIYAQELADCFESPAQVQCFSALCERSVGSVANLTVSEIERIAKLDPRVPELPSGWKSQSDFRLPFEGAESLLEAGQRVSIHLNDLVKREPVNQIQLVVGHGASFRHAAYHLNVIEFCDIRKLSMHYGQPVVFQRGPQGWKRLYGHWKQRKTSDRLD